MFIVVCILIFLIVFNVLTNKFFSLLLISSLPLFLLIKLSLSLLLSVVFIKFFFPNLLRVYSLTLMFLQITLLFSLLLLLTLNTNLFFLVTLSFLFFVNLISLINAPLSPASLLMKSHVFKNFQLLSNVTHLNLLNNLIGILFYKVNPTFLLIFNSLFPLMIPSLDSK